MIDFPRSSLMFPKVPQSSQTESLGFPSNTRPCPLEHPPLKNTTIIVSSASGGYLLSPRYSDLTQQRPQRNSQGFFRGGFFRPKKPGSEKLLPGKPNSKPFLATFHPTPSNFGQLFMVIY